MLGGCDLYITKASHGDKKLYKAIEQSLESQYASLLSFSAGLSVSEAASAAGSLNLSRASPFGSLSQKQCRKTYAYLIATLNASHPDYDFSHLLRPSDFHRDRSLKRVMNILDTTLYNLRPRPTSNFALGSAPHWAASVSASVPPPSPGNEVWNPRMWRIVDKEMDLKHCSIYCYLPEEDPFEGEDGAIWSFNYFFFNKERKRVCYIYLRGLSIISHSSTPRTPIRTKRDADSDWGFDERPSSKRARFWLGDKAANATSAWSDDDDDDDDDDNHTDDLITLSPSHLVKPSKPAVKDEDQTVLSSGEDTSPSAFDTASPESERRSPSGSIVRHFSQDAVGPVNC